MPSEILLLIEVSDATLAFDRGTKAPYYAKAGVPECWIIDLAGDQILVMRSPGAGRYSDVRVKYRGEKLSISALSDVVLDVAEVLGPAP